MNWISKCRHVLRAEGFLGLLRRMSDKVFSSAIEYPLCLLTSRETFRYDDNDLAYYIDRYNTTWRNERCLELAIVLNLLARTRPKDVLEIGNVLNHYAPFPHDVVDKYEQASGVQNTDVELFQTHRRYDCIVTISTIEHVGFDAPENRDPQKPARVLTRLRSLLRSRGILLATIPLRYNPSLDRLLLSGSLPFDEITYFRRVARTSWIAVPPTHLADVRFDSPWPQANALAVGKILAP